MPTSRPSSPQAATANLLVGPQPAPSSTPVVPHSVPGALPHLRSVPPSSNRPPSPDLPSPSRVQPGRGRNSSVGSLSSPVGAVLGALPRVSDPGQKVASGADGPLGSSPGDGDDDCRFVAEHPAARDEGGRPVSRIGSSVTSLKSRGNSPGLLGRPVSGAP